MKRFFLLLLQIIPLFLFSQNPVETIKDQRDGRVYEVLEIGQIKWFRDNLKFETVTSHCPNFEKKDSDCENGNFYSYQELEEVCPEGWRIPNELEWNQYFEYRLKEQDGEITAIKIDSINGDFLTVIYTDTEEKVNLFGAANPLKLNKFGWVQGTRIKNKKTTTLWIKHSEIEDDKFHIHIANEKYIVHSHKHNIDDVPKKSRKFMVKCVSGGKDE